MPKLWQSLSNSCVLSVGLFPKTLVVNSLTKPIAHAETCRLYSKHYSANPFAMVRKAIALWFLRLLQTLYFSSGSFRTWRLTIKLDEFIHWLVRHEGHLCCLEFFFRCRYGAC